MSLQFETVDDYVKYVEGVSMQFIKKELHGFITSKIMSKAMDAIYNREEPKMYVWTYTMVDWQYYKTEFDSSPTVSISDTSIDAYTYCNSPHAESVINGEPYDYHFKFYGVPRPFVADANKQINRTEMGKINNRLRRHYKANGLQAY